MPYRIATINLPLAFEAGSCFELFAAEGDFELIILSYSPEFKISHKPVWINLALFGGGERGQGASSYHVVLASLELPM